MTQKERTSVSSSLYTPYYIYFSFLKLFLKMFFFLSVVFLTIVFRCTLEQLRELSKFNLTWTVFVNLLNQLFYVNCHFKLTLDGLNQLFGVNSTVTIRLPTHCDKSIQQILLWRTSFVFSLFEDQLFKLRELDKSFVLRVLNRNHPVTLIFSYFLSCML